MMLLRIRVKLFLFGFLLCVDGTDTVRFEFAVDNTEYWYDAFEFS